MKLLKWAMALSLSALVLPAMACYTVYSPANQIVYSGEAPPIDMSYQIHEKLPAVFPTGHLVFGVDMDCPSIDTRKTAPQLTNVAVVSTRATGRSSPRMTRAQREREADALTK
ncbi:MAG: hypothetical protein V4573_07990 [Pseudomonadota bacterium]